MPPADGDTRESEIELGGVIPRCEPNLAPIGPKSGDLYIRLEGRIYGPVQPPKLEELLQSGLLTGLEVASPDLHRWTPLAYHPRIRRARVRNFERAHAVLAEASALPVRRNVVVLPKAGIVRKPNRRGRHQRGKPPSK